MPRKSIFDMPFSAVYAALINKAEKKGRTKAEVDEITCWLTGYSGLEELDGKTYGEFIAEAPSWNPRAERITGKICGVQVETIEDPLMKKWFIQFRGYLTPDEKALEQALLTKITRSACGL